MRPGASPLRIALIGPFRFPISQPFVGGLEAHVWTLAAGLQDRGHDVTLFAAAGSDRRIARHHHEFPTLPASADAGRRDVSGDPQLLLAEERTYRAVMAAIAGAGADRFDVVHNHALHWGPVRWAAGVGVPMLSTLHTPPITEVAQAMRSAGNSRQRFVAVSSHTARSWRDAWPAVGVVANGADTEVWQPGPGGGPLIWSGRIVPEKGAHLAIDAARRLGRALDLAGPIVDQRYFDAMIAPQLGHGVRYLGHLDRRDLAAVVGGAAVAVVTPRWPEPYGLVVAEALACGTPVAAFHCGGIPEILTPACGRLAAPDDVEGLAGAIEAASTLNRADARRRAVATCSISHMVSSYETIYRAMSGVAIGPPTFARTRAVPTGLARGHSARDNSVPA